MLLKISFEDALRDGLMANSSEGVLKSPLNTISESVWHCMSGDTGR